jgi:hypothetical protein
MRLMCPNERALQVAVSLVASHAPEDVVGDEEFTEGELTGALVIIAKLLADSNPAVLPEIALDLALRDALDP